MSDATVIRSILFADVVGFSKMPDAAYPGFMGEFLADVDRILSDSRHTALAPCVAGEGGVAAV